MARPEFPADAAKGDSLIMRAGTPGRRDGKTDHPVRVVTLGPKYIGVIRTDRYEAYLADPAANKWLVRKFLRDDQREGDRSSRIGYPAEIVTPEQAAYDLRIRRSEEHTSELQ